jgi:hypothetical protein
MGTEQQSTKPLDIAARDSLSIEYNVELPDFQ